MKELLTKEGADLNRPYEKCLSYGASALTDAELIAVIIRCGTRGQSATELAQKILRLPSGGSGLLGLCTLSAKDFMQLPGIGEVKAIQLMCVGELSRRIASLGARRGMQCSHPEDVARYYMEQLRHEEKEHVICMLLDTRLRFIGEEKIALGTVNQAACSVRDIFIAAVSRRAFAVLLVHNHPGGDPTPSADDIETTKKVEEAGRLLSIPLIDHIIIGDQSYVSFTESGLIQHGN